MPIGAAEQKKIDGAAVAPTETMFRYRGRDIPTAVAALQDLACIERGGQTTCYGSEAAMERAEHLVPMRERHVLARGASAQRPSHHEQRQRVRAANHGGNPLSIWEHADFHGWRIDTTTTCQWYNLPDGYNDEASSLNTGSHTGVVARHTCGARASISSSTPTLTCHT